MTPGDSQAIIRQLIGAWRLVSFHARTADGQVTYLYGRDAVGFYVFSESGYMSVALMRAHRPTFAAGDVLGGSLEEKAAAAEGYTSYCGRYEIRGNTVVVRPEVSFFPNWIGVEQVRVFELAGNTLTLSPPPSLMGGVQQTPQLVWERV